MSNYIDGFVLPIPKKHLSEYKCVAEKVAEILKEHGAIAYYEYVNEDPKMQGVPSFPEMLKAKEDEVVIFGWIVFESKAARDEANKKVPNDPRMPELMAPLTDPNNLIFDGKRMVYGGFESFINK